MDKHWAVFDLTAAGILIGNCVHMLFTADWLVAVLLTVSGIFFFIGGVVRIRRL